MKSYSILLCSAEGAKNYVLKRDIVSAIKLTCFGIFLLMTSCSVQTPKNKEVMVAHVNEIFSKPKHRAPWVLIKPVSLDKRPEIKDYRKYRRLFEPNLRKNLDLMCENRMRIGGLLDEISYMDDVTEEFLIIRTEYSYLGKIDFMRMSGAFFVEDSVVYLGTTDISDNSFSVDFRLDMKKTLKEGGLDPDGNRSHHVAVIIEKVRDNYYITDIKLGHIKNSRWIYPSLQSMVNDFPRFSSYFDDNLFKDIKAKPQHPEYSSESY